jgi:hypothetical protein
VPGACAGPWTNSCIGHRNYKAYLLLLVYGNAALWHALGLLVAHGLHLANSRSQLRPFR